MNQLNRIDRPFVCLVRHGLTQAVLEGRLDGLGDVPLTPFGEQQAASLQPFLAQVAWDQVLCSPLQRVRRTAQLAGFSHPEIVDRLREFDCGDYEGLTTQEIRRDRPDWDFWRDGCAGGETAATAAERIAPVIAGLKEARGATLVFSHAGTIRILVARWLGLPGHMGSAFGFDPAHMGIVRTRGGYPAIELWNNGEYLPASA